MSKAKLIEEMFEKGILLSEELLEQGIDTNLTNKLAQEQDLLVLNQDYMSAIKEDAIVDWYDIDRYRVDKEKGKEDVYQTHISHFKQAATATTYSDLESGLLQEEDSFEENTTSTIDTNTSQEIETTTSDTINDTGVNIVLSYDNVPKKYTIRDFSHIFLTRFRFLSKILRQRQEFQTTLPIHRLIAKTERETVTAIGLVQSVNTTKNGHILVTLEDPTGTIPILFSNKQKELLEQAKELVLDEVIGISGSTGDKIIFAQDIYWPDIPHGRELKKGPTDDHLLFLSDFHVGSDVFLAQAFDRFLKWINGDSGNAAQKEIADKVKYIVIAGDLVDGIGIYPGQKEELTIHDIKEQYDEFCNLIEKIPKDKQIIICPGNHDVIHLAEPQPVFYKDWAPRLHELENVTLVSNPAVINVGKTPTFPGFDILMYHGFSFDHYIANVEVIRNNGGYHRADLVMKFLLKRRHLAPTFGSTPYYPGHEEDPLLIKHIPDFFITGHIHYSKVANYKGVTMICGSCWQGMTAFQEKLGHQPEPGRVPVVNLKTREVRVLRFV